MNSYERLMAKVNAKIERNQASDRAAAKLAGKTVEQMDKELGESVRRDCQGTRTAYSNGSFCF